jgi:hypothetical protein
VKSLPKSSHYKTLKLFHPSMQGRTERWRWTTSQATSQQVLSLNFQQNKIFIIGMDRGRETAVESIGMWWTTPEMTNSRWNLLLPSLSLICFLHSCSGIRRKKKEPRCYERSNRQNK